MMARMTWFWRLSNQERGILDPLLEFRIESGRFESEMLRMDQSKFDQFLDAVLSR